MTGLPMTDYQKHARRWGKGCGSDQCQTGGRVCLARGKVPADIVFVGEAPGESENVLGRPFVGQAGKLLDLIIDRALTGLVAGQDKNDQDVPIRYALTNLVGCIPRERDGAKSGEPDIEQIERCQPRLEEFLSIARPRLVVCVGSLARDFIKPGYMSSIKLPDPRPQVTHITHPAAILRMNIVQRGLEVQRCVVTIQNAVEDL